MKIKSMKPEARREHVNGILKNYGAVAATRTGIDDPEPLLQITLDRMSGDRVFLAYPQCMYVVAPWFGTAADLLIVSPRNGSKKRPVAVSLATIVSIDIGDIEDHADG